MDCEMAMSKMFAADANKGNHEFENLWLFLFISGCFFHSFILSTLFRVAIHTHNQNVVT